MNCLRCFLRFWKLVMVFWVVVLKDGSATPDNSSIDDVIATVGKSNPDSQYFNLVSNITTHDVALVMKEPLLPIPLNNTTNFGKITMKTRRRRRRRRKNRLSTTSTSITVPTTTEQPKSDVKFGKRRRRKKPRRRNNTKPKIHTRMNISSRENELNIAPSVALSQNNVSASRNSTNPRKTQTPCSKNNGGCAHLCHYDGKINCACLDGFFLANDGKDCTDLDECGENNGGCEFECFNTRGAFECGCPAGLRLSDDGRTCQDVNVCLLRNGHGPCQGTCENNFGGYKCSCERLNGTILGEDKHSCVDIDECFQGTSGCSHICINAIGTSFCSCPNGLELSSDWKTCIDIDECEDSSVRNKCETGCVNTEGSYYCLEDFSALQNDQSLRRIACKPLFPPEVGFVSCSRDGAVRSFSKNGRKRFVNSPGTVCKLECPVGYKISGGFHVTCGLDGKWEGKHDGKCVGVPPPVLECPRSKNYYLEPEQDEIKVKFSSPTTNVGWRHLKSNPKWAKRLKGKLKRGKHEITFTVTDPSSKLTTSCFFKINVV